MELNKTVRICELFEIYGVLLSKTQKKLTQQHYCFDISLSEISQNEKISRQAVLDAIIKSEKKLEEYESVLHLYELKQLTKRLSGNANDIEIIKKIREII